VYNFRIDILSDYSLNVFVGTGHCKNSKEYNYYISHTLLVTGSVFALTSAMENSL